MNREVSPDRPTELGNITHRLPHPTLTTVSEPSRQRRANENVAPEARTRTRRARGAQTKHPQ